MALLRKQRKNKKVKSHTNVRLKNPLISVITVCRNAEKTITKTIESVLGQTYSNLEYLIIDGASTDRTIEIIKQYEPKFKGRLRLITERDAGIYDAMNKGVRLATGKIIGIINSDDWYELDAVERVVESYKETGDGVYYGILRVMENGKEVMLKSTHYQFLYRDIVGHPAYFVSSKIYQTHGLFNLDYKIASDYELMMRFIQRNVRFVQVNFILANFNYGGISSNFDIETFIEYEKIRYMYGYITKRRMQYMIFRLRLRNLFKVYRWFALPSSAK